MVSRLFDRYTKGSPSGGIDAEAILGAKVVDSRENGLPQISNDNDQYDTELHITNNGVYHVDIEQEFDTPQSATWNGYSRSGWQGSFSTAREPAATASDLYYYNTTLQYFLVSYQLDPLFPEFRWTHVSAPLEYIGHFESRTEATHHVSAVGQIAYTGSEVQVVTGLIAGASARTFRHWQLVNLTPRNVAEALKAALDGILSLDEINLLISLLEDTSKASTDLQNIDTDLTTTEQETIRTRIGAGTGGGGSQSASDIRDLLQTLTAGSRLATSALYRTPFNLIDTDLTISAQHTNGFLNISGSANITLVDSVMHEGDEIVIYNGSQGSRTITATGGDIQGSGPTFTLERNNGIVLIKRSGTQNYSIVGTSQLNTARIPEFMVNADLDLRGESNYNLHKNTRIVLASDRFVNITLPRLSSIRPDYVSEDDFFEFEVRATGLARLTLTPQDNINESFSNTTASTYVLSIGTTATLSAPDNRAVRLTVPADSITAWAAIPIHTIQSLADSMEAQVSYWSDNDDGNLISSAPVAGLRRTSTVFMSTSGDDTWDGKGLDRPVTSQSRITEVSDNLDFAAGASHRCDDDSYFSYSYDGRSDFDLWAPEASFRGLRPAADTRIRAKTILTSSQEIVLPSDVDIELEKIENTTVGAQIQWLGQTHNNTRLIIHSANFATTPMTFANNLEGNIHIEIYESNLTSDPFETVRDSLNLTGFIRMSDGSVLPYGTYVHHGLIEASSSSVDTAPFTAYESVDIVSENSNFPSHVIAPTTQGDLIVGAPCYLTIQNIAANLEWTDSSEYYTIGDTIRAGQVTSTSDVDEVFSFSPAFAEGDAAEVFVVTVPAQLNRERPYPVTASDNDGFTLNRQVAEDGDVPVNYIAVQGDLLGTGGTTPWVTGGYNIQVNGLIVARWECERLPKIQSLVAKNFNLISGPKTLFLDVNDTVRIRRNFPSNGDGMSLSDFEMNISVVLR